MLEPGIRGTRYLTVTPAHTAKAMGSGELEVLATPAMIALMEETAWRSVSGALEPGSGTVGTALNISHLAPTPVGMEVRCESELLRVEDRKLTFRLEVYDAAGKIGEGAHERFVVLNGRFQEKAERRGNS